MMKAFNPKYPESEAFQDQPWLQNEFKASLNNLVRYCLIFLNLKKYEWIYRGDAAQWNELA